ncbi:MAG: hypothetical protein WDM96_11900 [Lacunisphaera sp.]
MKQGILIVLVAGLVASFVGYFYWALQMVHGRQSDVSAFDRRVAFNPFNLCFRPSLLTEEGLRARKMLFRSCAGILLSFVALGVFGFFANAK